MAGLQLFDPDHKYDSFQYFFQDMNANKVYLLLLENVLTSFLDLELNVI